jgi:hypothetical protein
MIQAEEDDLHRRGLAAYYRSGGAVQPPPDGGVVTIQGLCYVHLHTGMRTLAVYRVDSIGRLKRLKRFPKQLVGER